MSVPRILPLVTAILLAALTPCGEAQAITPLVVEGDNVPGVGTVTLVAGMAVDDAGNVLVHVLTDNPDPNQNGAMVAMGGTPIVKEGLALVEPAGAVLQSFYGGEVRMNAAGTPLFYLFIDPPVPADTGIYRGTTPILDVLVTDPCTASGAPPASTYSILLPGLINAAEDLCFYAVLDDPAVTGSFDVDVVMVVSTSTGVQTVRATQGDFLPGQPFETLKFNWQTLAFNTAGDVIFSAQTAGPSGHNMVLYLNDTELAQDGDPSPFGINYGGFGQTSLTDNGDHVFKCSLNGGGSGIVGNGAAFIRTNDTLPDIEPFLFNNFGSPLFIGLNGRVLWTGTWDTPAPLDSVGLFADYNLLVEQGVTEIGGLMVEVLPTGDRSYAMSSSGRYVVFEATLEGGLEGAFLIDLGA